MIPFFIEPYPDELVYSWFARYGVRTGYTHYRAIAEDLFVSNTAKPNLEFIMELNKEAYDMVTKYKPFEDIIKQHSCWLLIVVFFGNGYDNDVFFFVVFFHCCFLSS